MTRTYDYRRVVTFQDTNVVGNVYFANLVAWQGACREHFLRDRAPGVLQQLGAGLSLVTVSCQCEFLAEVFAFDEVIVKMSLIEALHNRLDLRFDYVRIAAGAEELVAIGRHRVACLRHDGVQPVAAPIPDELRAAALEYR
ncbi:MAG TPA: acyl-CoA thioesterase [Kofleriaceae bacterium]|jgi:enediyne biosynthesis thioesterase|nr:acyl-CoA thioesterase [Kofleriaceae bacterium]